MNDRRRGSTICLCGGAIPAGHLFCPSCGLPVEECATPAHQEAEAPAAETRAWQGEPPAGAAPRQMPSPSAPLAPTAQQAPLPPEPYRPGTTTQTRSSSGGAGPRKRARSPEVVLGLIGLGAVVLILVLVLASVLSRPQSSPGGSLTGNPGATGIPRPAGTPPPTAAPTIRASTSTPAPTPTATPTPPGSPVSTSTFTLVAPAPLQVRSQDNDSVNLYEANPADSGVRVYAAQQSSPATVPGLQSQALSSMQSNYGSVGTCVASDPISIGNISGTLIGYLYTYSPTDGTAPFAVCNAFWFGTNADGTVEYEFQEFARQADYPSLDPLAVEVRNSIQWLV